jgi:hypothetical protein
METAVISHASREATAETRASLPPSSVTIDGHTQSSVVDPNPANPNPEGEPYTLETALKAAASSDAAYQEVIAALEGGRKNNTAVGIPKISPALQKAQVHPSQCEVKDGLIFVSHRL